MSMSTYSWMGKGTVSGKSNCRLIRGTPVTEHIKDKLDPRGNSQLFEDPVDVVPDGMFLHFKPLGDFAVLQAVGDEANHVFFAARHQRRSLGIRYLNRLKV